MNIREAARVRLHIAPSKSEYRVHMQDPRDGRTSGGVTDYEGVDMTNAIPWWLKPMAHRVTLRHLREFDFWSRVDVRAPEECWFMRRHRPDYRPVIHIPTRITGIGSNVTFLASRASAALHRGRLVPNHLVVDHLCGNPPCVNPHHLDVVTQRTNLARARVTA